MSLGAKGMVEVDNQLKIILGSSSGQLKKYIQDMKWNCIKIKNSTNSCR